MGPAPALIYSFKGIFRFSMLIKTDDLTKVKDFLKANGLQKDMNVIIDIDPITTSWLGEPMNRDLLENKLTAAYDYFKKVNDTRNMHRISNLAQKLYSSTYDIAFAGHFSAGKSLLINSFLGDNILPSSPIPTSANLVKIHKGTEDFARVFFHKGMF